VTPEQVCLFGVVADAEYDYRNWGAGFGLLLAEDEVPFDSAALGVGLVDFDVVGVKEPPNLRVMATMIDDPAIADSSQNYQDNPFIWNGSPTSDLAADGAYTLPLDEFLQPEWTNLDADGDGFRDAGLRIDATRLHSLQFLVVTRPSISAEYDFCISSLSWRDAAGAAVDVDGLSQPPK
jgi:hypothetical protein